MTGLSAGKGRRQRAKSALSGASSSTNSDSAKVAELAENPVARSMLAAGLVTAAAALTANAKVRATVRDAGRDALDTAEAAADSATKIGAAIVTAATDAVRRLLAAGDTGGVANVRDRKARSTVQPQPLGDESKRGSFGALVEDIEQNELSHGEEPTVSSAAFRAGSIIRMMRRTRGLSQAGLAKSLGVTQARVSELEAGLGPRGPSWDLMERVASACSATILISRPESGIAIDASAPDDTKRQWTIAVAGG
jgi:DNA-binding XRE family transcriptional regulator